MVNQRRAEVRHQEIEVRNSRAALWLGLCTFIAEATGSVPGQGTKIPCRQQGAVKKKKKQQKKHSSIRLSTASVRYTGGTQVSTGIKALAGERKSQQAGSRHPGQES